jgi:hypothetical protein
MRNFVERAKHRPELTGAAAAWLTSCALTCADAYLTNFDDELARSLARAPPSYTPASLALGAGKAGTMA